MAEPISRPDLSFLIIPQKTNSSRLSRTFQLRRNQQKCLHQLARRIERSLPLRQVQAAITAAAAAIPTATGPERARARALRTDQTDTDQTVTTAVAKTKTDTTSDDTEMLQRNRSCFLIKRVSYQGAT